MKKTLFSLVVLILLTSCESVKKLNFKDMRKECPEKKTLSDILCKDKK